MLSDSWTFKQMAWEGTDQPRPGNLSDYSLQGYFSIRGPGYYGTVRVGVLGWGRGGGLVCWGGGGKGHQHKGAAHIAGGSMAAQRGTAVYVKGGVAGNRHSGRGALWLRAAGATAAAVGC